VQDISHRARRGNDHRRRRVRDLIAGIDQRTYDARMGRTCRTRRQNRDELRRFLRDEPTRCSKRGERRQCSERSNLD
jgi:hypothetical protein